jgi:hypothetical protein
VIDERFPSGSINLHTLRAHDSDGARSHGVGVIRTLSRPIRSDFTFCSFDL